MNNKERIKYFYEVIVSENRIDQLSQFVADDCVLNTGTASAAMGLAGMGEHLLAVKKTYPDCTMKILRQFEDGNYVISEFLMKGTHRGEFLRIAPTGKSLQITGVNIDKVENGKITEHGGAANTFETFFEHGLIRPV